MKNILLTIPIIFIMTACSSLEDQMLIKAEALYKNGDYTKARHLCENVLIEDPYNKEAIVLCKKVYKTLRDSTCKHCHIKHSSVGYSGLSYSGISLNTLGLIDIHSRNVDTIDDRWRYAYLECPIRKKQLARRAKIREELKEFDNIIIQDLNIDTISYPSLVKHLAIMAKNNDPEKRNVEIFYTGIESDKHVEFMLTLDRISLAEVIIAIFGDDTYKIITDGHKILIKKLKDN